MRLTTSSIASLTIPASKTDHIEWDDDLPGFGVRIRSSGSKTYLIQTRLRSKAHYRESLGDVRKVTLEDARSVARKLFAQIELGLDPRAERSALVAAGEARKHTLAIVAEQYLEARSVGSDGRSPMRTRTLKASRRYFEVHWAPLRQRPIAEIKREDVAKRLREITTQHGRTAAARARGNLSALFSWAMKSEYSVDANPVINTHNPVRSDEMRDRVLDDDELRAVWSATRDDDFGRITQLLLLTACRRDEIGSLRWSEVDLGAGRITIAGERTKNGHAHSLLLPAKAVAILREIKRKTGRDFVFGGRGGGYSAWSYSTLHFNARITEQGRALAPWRLHDFRRTVRTRLPSLGVLPHIAELVLNHIKGKSKIERVYDHYDYDKEKAEALAKWAKHLIKIVEPIDNVFSLRA
jgi:integrase